MKIRLNGEDYTVEQNCTVAGLLEKLDIHPQRVAVEVNLKIVKKSDYSSYIIKEGDVVEVVSFVGGG
jgi:sulfur carrier protein